MNQTYYSKGMDKAISQIHEQRTAQNSCAYLLPFILPHHNILDVGCGPGTITIDIAKNYLGEEGKITGVDLMPELINQCNHSIPSSLNKRVSFLEASAYLLPFPDSSFDIVYCHQLLLHLPDPLRAMKEMKRVVKEGGIVCSKDCDLDTTLVHPEKFHKMIHFSLTGKNDRPTNIKFGRSLRELSLNAGFESSKVKTSTSNWSMSSDEERKWLSEMFVKRIASSSETYDEKEEKNNEVKEKAVEAWKGWRDAPGGWFVMTNFEVVCQK